MRNNGWLLLWIEWLRAAFIVESRLLCIAHSKALLLPLRSNSAIWLSWSSTYELLLQRNSARCWWVPYATSPFIIFPCCNWSTWRYSVFPDCHYHWSIFELWSNFCLGLEWLVWSCFCIWTFSPNSLIHNFRLIHLINIACCLLFSDEIAKHMSCFWALLLWLDLLKIIAYGSCKSVVLS